MRSAFRPRRLNPKSFDAMEALHNRYGAPICCQVLQLYIEFSASLRLGSLVLIRECLLFSPADVAHELFDYELLVGDDRLHDIADRDETDEFSVFDDGKMAGAFFGHQ